MDPRLTWWRSASDADEPRAPILVIVVADDPDAVSVLPPDHGSRWREQTLAGSTATARVAEHLGVPIHFAEDGQLPAGHDLILLGEAGRGMTSLASQVACTHLNAEPQMVVGFGSGITDIAWMRKVAAVRDTCRATAGTSTIPEPVEHLAALLTAAADAGVPVLIDGSASAAGAMVADRRPSMQAPVLGDEPAHRMLLDHLDLGPWGTGGIGPGQGLGALCGLEMLRLSLLAADV